tara:strand:- start:515 stop:664 length:150 start_codon:yes stop_codon:yes gene_type:complete
MMAIVAAQIINIAKAAAAMLALPQFAAVIMETTPGIRVGDSTALELPIL